MEYLFLKTILCFSRYIAVCFPFFRLRHNIKARVYIIPILLFAPLYNVPRFFEFDTSHTESFRCLDHGHSLLESLANENMTKTAYLQAMSPQQLQELQNNNGTTSSFLSSQNNSLDLVNLPDSNKRIPPNSSWDHLAHTPNLVPQNHQIFQESASFFVHNDRNKRSNDNSSAEVVK